MQLHIENIMAIDSADIDLDGITVVVGNNNTGKSTTGKVLWAMFNALGNLSEQTHKERVQECQWIITRFIFRFPYFTPDYKDIVNELVQHKISVDDFINKLQEDYLKGNISVDDKSKKKIVPDWEQLKKQIQNVLNIDEEDLQKQVVLSSFNKIFCNQFIPLFKEHGTPLAQMTIQGKKITVDFTEELPKLDINVDLQNQAYFFSNPSLLERLGDRLSGGSRDSSLYIFSKQMTRIWASFSEEGSAIENILARNQYSTVQDKLSDILDGQVVYDKENSIFKFCTEKYINPLKLSNLSQGMKAMAMLQVAFSRGAIKERDVLILDEPEIHLHPEWQIRYAELIVLLQKAFNLTVLLTSHSPDFVEAIRRFSEKYGVSGKLNGYISKMHKNGKVTMQKVSAAHWEKMFEKFADSVDLLLNLSSDNDEEK